MGYNTIRWPFALYCVNSSIFYSLEVVGGGTKISIGVKNKFDYSKLYGYTALQSQKTVSAYFTSKQILPLGFAQYSCFIRNTAHQ